LASGERETSVQSKFGAFTFDDATRELRCGDQLIHLSPKAFDLLGLMLRRRPNAVSKADLQSELWPDTFVSDGGLAVLVAEIRRVLGDSAHCPSFVRTVNRFGYAFVGADVAADAPSTIRAAARCSLIWGNGERARLKPGENVLGRDPDADVCIDAVGVSRRHAVIVVGDDGVTLHDLSSKNGTFMDGTRVTSPVALSDDTEIRLGAVCVRFRRATITAPTQTVEESPRVRGSS
jgi:DNA-binding winged helix-turn-helix (wHTH) protein